MSGEPHVWTVNRQARLASQFPVFKQNDAKTVLNVDGFRAVQGQAPTDWSQAVMRLAARAAQGKNAGTS